MKNPEHRKTKTPELYTITETKDGEFEVTFPGGYDEERAFLIGQTQMRYKSREMAEQAVKVSRESATEFFERHSLEKTFTNSFYRIDKTEDGRYLVTTPGGVESKTGFYIGTTSREFSTWQDARDYYLQEQEYNSELSAHPILELRMNSTETIAFSNLDAFNPKTAPSEKPRDMPRSIEELVQSKETEVRTDKSASTYQETIREEGWERRLFEFISDYFRNEGSKFVEELGIKNLDALTPRQAVELTTLLVVELTKYNESKTEPSDTDLAVDKKTEADKSTAIQLLKEGRARKRDRDWEGNGVCRNFASITKAVFEALKANQTKFSRLEDTYCLYDSGFEQFAPKRKDANVTQIKKIGHAWNTFMTVSGKKAAATVVDTTWARKDLDTGKLKNIDYTPTRMELLVYMVAMDMSEDMPDKEKQLRNILEYYLLKIESLDHRSQKMSNVKDPAVEQYISQTQQEKEFFISRAISIIGSQSDIIDIPKGLIRAIAEGYTALAAAADISEIETIWRIAEAHPELQTGGILERYLGKKELTDYNDRQFISRDDNLQRELFEYIKTRPKFRESMDKCPRFRARMREVLPEFFMGFDPGSDKADAQELGYLLNSVKSFSLRRIFNPRQPSKESVEKLFKKVRETLQKINPEAYEQIVGDKDNYQIVKDYNSISLKLKRHNRK